MGLNANEEENLKGYPSIDKPWMKYYAKYSIPKTIPSQSMYQLIYEANTSRLSNIAISYFGNNISYGSLFKMIEQTARAFVSHGIAAGDTVCILSLNTPEMCCCMYALNKIGAIVDYLSPYSQQEELYEEIKTVNAKLFIVLDRMAEKLDLGVSPANVMVLSLAQSMKGVARIAAQIKAPKGQFCSFDKYISEAYDDLVIHQATDCGDCPALYLHTSGTTGKPKCVVLTNNNMNAVAIQCSLSGQNYQPHEKFLNILPPFISFGAAMMHLCFYVGMNEIIHLVPTVKSVGKMFTKHKPERFVFGPALIELIEDCPNMDLSHLIELTGGGDAISKEKEEKINSVLKSKKCPSKYLAGYGMTELGSAATMNHNSASKLQSIGYPLPMTNVKIINIDTGEELPSGAEGELYIASPALMMGYLYNADETERIISVDSEGTRWIRTGDLAKIDEDGFVFVTGRIKKIYTTKFEGEVYKAFPNMIENIVELISGVEKCGVVMLPDEKRGSKPYVFAKKTDGIAEDVVVESIKQAIREQLPPYYETDNVTLLERMPLTASQKIDYRALEKLVESMEK